VFQLQPHITSIECLQPLLDPTSSFLSLRLVRTDNIAHHVTSLYQTLFTLDSPSASASLLHDLLTHLTSELECVFSRLVLQDRATAPASLSIPNATPIYHPRINKLTSADLETLFMLDMRLLGETATRAEPSQLVSIVAMIFNQYAPLTHPTLMMRPTLQLCVLTRLFQLEFWYASSSSSQRT
jgi:hypothetical protein